MSGAAALAALLGLLLSAPGAGAGTEGEGAGEPPRHPEVLVVVNGASPASVAIGEYYRRKRDVPRSNVLTIHVPLADPALGRRPDQAVSRGRFERRVRDPIARFLREEGLAERIRFIVLAKGVPLRVSAPCDASSLTYLRDCARASVGAELALLFSGRDGVPGIEGMANPYFDSELSFEAFRKAHPDAPLRYLVTRLDGYQEPLDEATGIPRDVKALIDRASAAGAGGTYVVDEDPGATPGRRAGNVAMLRPAAGQVSAMSRPLVHETGDRSFVSGVEDIAGYASWGSLDAGGPGKPFYGEIRGKLYPGTFAPRAVSVDLVSSNGRSFVHPPSYGQSLLADLIRLGVSGAAGNVFEPLLTGVTRPEVLFRAHAQTSRSAGAAYYKSVPYLGWMNTYVGDPLMPAPSSAAAPDDRDGDGVPDASDNCVRIPNAAQRDSNGDGYGNLCDADVNGDGVVDTSWGAVSPPDARGDYEAVAITARSGGGDPDHDLDGDGDVDATDLTLVQLQLFHPPGPSGVAP